MVHCIKVQGINYREQRVKVNVQELFLKVWKLILYKSMSKSEKQLLAFELTIRFEIEGLRKEADPSTSNFFPSGK